MEVDLPAAAGLLPPAARFDAIGYACTSGTTLIGARRVADLVKGAATTLHVTDPLTATLAALRALDIGAVGIVSPYEPAVAGPVAAAVEAADHPVRASLSFGERVESRVARVDPASIHAAALKVGRAAGVEAVFVSCTNLRTLEIIDDLEQRLEVPVLGSNLCLMWHMARVSGIALGAKAPGRLALSP